MKKILVLGGTGAMGRYLVPELLKLGYKIDVISLDDIKSDNDNLSYKIGNAKDIDQLSQLLKGNYDGIVDFMTYNLNEFKERIKLFLDNTGHYLFLSSCRVFANEDPIVKETSPRLLDISTDEEYLKLKETEYSLFKALEENMLTESGYRNWTIVRPATTYSTGRAQLVTLEANSFVYRALENKKVIIPIQAKDCPATLSWGGDVGKMIARIVLNEKALGEDYNVATSEYHTWGEIAEMYTSLIGLKYEWVDKETYLRCIADDAWYPYAKYQLIYARMFNRKTDNTKVLRLTGLKQEELMPLYDGLKTELAKVSLDTIKPNKFICDNMDKYFASKK